MKVDERLAGMLAAYRDLSLRGARNAAGMKEAAAALAIANKRLPDMVHAELDTDLNSGELAKRFAALSEGRDVAEAVAMVVREYIERMADRYAEATDAMRLDAARSEGTAAAHAATTKALQHLLETMATPEPADAAQANVPPATEEAPPPAEPPAGD